MLHFLTDREYVAPPGCAGLHIFGSVNPHTVYFLLQFVTKSSDNKTAPSANGKFKLRQLRQLVLVNIGTSTAINDNLLCSLYNRTMSPILLFTVCTVCKFQMITSQTKPSIHTAFFLPGKLQIPNQMGM